MSKREQGSWAHPSLRDAVEGVDSCAKPNFVCSASSGPEDWWCHNCIAHRGLREANAVMVQLASHNLCDCDKCREIKRLVTKGEAEAAKWAHLFNPKPEGRKS